MSGPTRVSTALQAPQNTFLPSVQCNRRTKASCSRPTANVAAAAAAQQQQQQLVALNEDQQQLSSPNDASTASPWCVILPNGRQFQLQELCTRTGRHSLWGCEATALLTTAEPVLVDEQQQQQLAAADDQQSGHEQLPLPPQQPPSQQPPPSPQQQQQQHHAQTPWVQQWQALLEHEQQQMQPLSKHHLRRLQMLQQQQQQQLVKQEQQRHLQQQVAAFSQQAAAQCGTSAAAPAVPVQQQSTAQDAGSSSSMARTQQQLQHQQPSVSLSPAAAAAAAAAAEAAESQELAAALHPPAAARDSLDAAAPSAPAAAATPAGSDVTAAEGVEGQGPPSTAAAVAGAVQQQPAAVTAPAVDDAVPDFITGEDAGRVASRSTSNSTATTPLDEQHPDGAAAAAAVASMQAALLPPPVLQPAAWAAPYAAAAGSSHAEGLLSWSFAEDNTAAAEGGNAVVFADTKPSADAGAPDTLPRSAEPQGVAEAAPEAAPAAPALEAAEGLTWSFLEQVADETAAAAGAATVTAVERAIADKPQTQAVRDSMQTALDAVRPSPPLPPAAAAAAQPRPLLPVEPLRMPLQQQLLQPLQDAKGLLQLRSRQQQQQPSKQHEKQQPSQQQQQQQHAVTAGQLQEQHIQQKQEQHIQHKASRGSSRSSREAVLLNQIAAVRTCHHLCLLVMQQTNYAAGQSGSQALQVNLQDWTPAVVAAALERFRKLTPYTLVAGLKAKQERQHQHQRLQHPPAPLGISKEKQLQQQRQHSASSSSSSRSTSTGVEPSPAAAAAAVPDDAHPSSFNLKLLMRVYVRLIDILELQLTKVPPAALADAAVCASSLLGRSCKLTTWWRAARGHMVLSEAALRLKEGQLPVSAAIQLCYSYSHCDHLPTDLLQALVQRVQDTPGVLEQQTLKTLCHFTFCVTSHRAHLTAIDPAALTSAVLQALPLQDISASGQAMLVMSVEALGGRVFDLVMLLRHMCQLNCQPPAGMLQLLPVLSSSMPMMTMQEMCTVLSAAVAWDLPNKLELAASAAVAAMSAAGLVGQDTQQQQQQSSGSGDSKQSRPVARTAADAVLLLHRFRMIGYQPPQQLTHHLLSFIAPRLHQVSLMQANFLRAVLVHNWQDGLSCQLLMNKCMSQWLIAPSQQQEQQLQQQQPEQHHHSSSSSSGRVPQYRLHPSLLLLPHYQLKALVIAAGRFGVLRAEVEQFHADEQTTSAPEPQGQQQQQKQQDDDNAVASQHQLQSRQQQQLQQQHALRALQPASHHQQQQQRQPQQQQQQQTQQPSQPGVSRAVVSTPATGGNSNGMHTHSGDGSGCMASTFISTVLQQLTPAVLREWRADLVLALLWSAARLKLQPSQELLSAGSAVLVVGMHRSIAAREMPLLLWTAAALKMTDRSFLEVLCGRVARCAGQFAPPSIASAAWAMVQLRYPHSAALAVLSRELLRPTPWLWDPEAFKVQQWCSRPSSQLRQLPELQLTADGVLPDAVAAFCSRYSDGDAWGSWQRPMPRRLWEDNNSPGLGLGLAKQQAKRLGGRIKGRSSRSNDPRSVSLDVVVNPTLGSVHQQHLLLAHPRVRQLRAADVAKLASSCCLAGWAAPQLFSVLAARAEELMPEMSPADLCQVMWAYAAANCQIRSLVRAAAHRTVVLGRACAFSTSRQPAVLLGAFKALGALWPAVQQMLDAELDRLRQMEAATSAVTATTAQALKDASVAPALRPC